MILKLGKKHLGIERYKVYINHDPGMTLTYFTARSTYVAHAFEWEIKALQACMIPRHANLIEQKCLSINSQDKEQNKILS